MQTIAGKKLEFADLYVDHATGKLTKYFCLHKGQQDIIDSKADYVLALGGADSGKSSVAALWLLLEVEKSRGRGEYLVIGPSTGNVLRFAEKVLCKVFAGTAYHGTLIVDEAKCHYKLPQGGTIHIRGAEAAISGMKPKAVILDEGGRVPVKVWKTVKERVTGGGRILVSTTPYIEYDWLRTEIMNYADAGNPDYFYRCFPTYWNPSTDLKKLEDAKSTRATWDYEMNYLGQFSKPPSMVYDWLDGDGNSCIVDVPEEGFPRSVKYVAGLDWGGSDPTCMLIGMLDGFDVLWIFWEYYKAEMNIKEVFEDIYNCSQELQRSTNGKKLNRLYCDHRSENIKVLKKELNLPAVPAMKASRAGQGSVSLGISLVQARIKTGRLKIIRSACPALVREGETYRYPTDERGEVISSTPMDRQEDHALDALRYLVVGVDQKNYGIHIKKAKYGYDD